MTALRLNARDTDAGVLLTLVGEFELTSVGVVGDDLRRIEKDKPQLIIIDLRQVEFIDSTALGVLVGAHRRARDEGRRILLLRPVEHIWRLFQVTGLNQVFDVADAPPDGAD